MTNARVWFWVLGVSCVAACSASNGGSDDDGSGSGAVLGASVNSGGSSGDATAGGATPNGATHGTTTAADSGNGTANTADAGSAGGNGSTDAAAANNASSGPHIGSACATDDDCGGGGLMCAQGGANTFAGGGPAHGYCTTQCNDYVKGTVNSDPCEALGGVCTNVGSDTQPEGWCLLKCTVDPNGLAFSKSKCHGRQDTGCLSFDGSASNSACVPTCAKDSDCGAGRKCDLSNAAFAICRDAASVRGGKPLGSSCQADPNGCAGACFNFNVAAADGAANGGGVANVCSNTCVIGMTSSCGFAQGAIQPGLGYCLFGTGGAGDRGICGALCDVASDCPNQDEQPTCNMSTSSNLGHGYCVANSPGAGPVDAGQVADGG